MKKQAFIIWTGLALLSACHPVAKNRKVTNSEISMTSTSGNEAHISGQPSTHTPKFRYDPVDLKALYEKEVKNQEQHFVIKSNKDTILKGRKGVCIHIPANAFDTETDHVTLSLKEFITLSDMVENQLVTMSGNKLLRSKGMIHIGAKDLEGKELTLKKGESISIVFPSATGDNEDYQLFEGQPGKEHDRIDWVPKNETSQPNSFLTSAAFENKNKAKWDKKIRLANTLNTNVFSMTGLDTLKKYLSFQGKYRRKRIKGRVNFKLTINQFGEVDTIEMTRGIHPVLDTIIESALLKISDWTPAIVYGIPHPTIQVMRFHLDLTNNTAKIYYPDQVLPKMKYRKSECTGAIALAQKYKEENIKEHQAKIEFKKNLKKGINRVVRSSAENIKGYVLQASKLGWINCDRFYRLNKEEKFDLYVKFEDDADKQAVLALGGEVKALMSPTRIVNSESLMVFDNIPKKGLKKLIGTKKSGDKLLMAFQPVGVEKNPLNLKYESVTYQDIKNELASLNSLKK